MQIANDAAPAASFLNNPVAVSAHDNNNAMDIDDMDIDLGLEPELDYPDVEQEMNVAVPHQEAPSNTVPHQSGIDSSTTNPDAALASEKVHIRGLDNLTTSDIRTFASEHFPNSDLVRIEWIDDTSANIVYETDDVASRALESFIANTEERPSSPSNLQLRHAKSLSTHPDTSLQVRAALSTDVKKAHAREASRFYLLNPDKDPGQKRRTNDGTRGRRNGGQDDRRYNKRQREEDNDVPFDVNMYDDDPTSLAARITNSSGRPRRASTASDDARRRKRLRFGEGRNEDLFLSQGGKNGDGRLRGRSASPARDGDGRLGFEDSNTQPSHILRQQDPGSGRANAAKELFPINAGKELFAKGKISALSNAEGKELFPEKISVSSSANNGIELFPRKGSTSNHHRKNAFDAADETSDAYGSLPGSPDLRSKPRNLADRISGGTGRLSKPADSTATTEGFSIRGAAQQQDEEANPGFSIRGAAGLNPRVKELFPNKDDSNAGKELFGTKIRGRGAVRQRAEDMFT